ncbi:MAG TPA: benzoate-CoA ligase family protein [Pyrinomonadaceae bacterium]|nr:benzoate-CoA ligase family protein [Pyrinomonadaceae bacterium]
MSPSNLFEHLFPMERDASIAILFEHREITYRELREQTRTLAEILKAEGIKPGDRVALLLADSPEFIAAFVAIISLGAIAIPINLALQSAEQLFIVQDCGARAAIVEGQAARTLIEGFDSSANLKTLFTVRDDVSLPTATLRVFALERAPRQKIEAFPAKTIPSDDAFILYTSGSTGQPKGAVHSQNDIFYTNETFCREVLQLRDDDRVFSSSRLPFAYGLGNSLTFPLLNGRTIVLCREKPTPEVVGNIFKEYRPTIFFGVPVVYRMLLEHHRNVAPLDTASLRLCISAGEALPAHLGQEWQDTFGVEVLDGIGSTEMLHMFMSNHSGDVRYGSSGKLLKGYEARLVDHDGNPTRTGEEGNLWIQGDSAASRYWQRPEISAETFVDGWVRTGDLYASDADGFWWHMGRSDDCFKPTGQWVSPIEVESVLLKHASVRAAAVVEGFDEAKLSCVCAFIVSAADTEEIENELRELCRNALPRFKQPRRYLFVSDLPYTATGKVQRFKLREQLSAQTARVANS